MEKVLSPNSSCVDTQELDLVDLTVSSSSAGSHHRFEQLIGLKRPLNSFDTEDQLGNASN